ncbi:hypothetical protein Scep_005366 [Stephania cephalantha]|uniref:Methyltransferase-like protein 13 n=1 Tax=Stephania cephalantha TaxID=152367 RepID=A0AAP0KVW8_9MAGN
MGVNGGTFETLTPSQFISFTFPNPSRSSNHYGDSLRIAVLDSPNQPPDRPKIAAMIVPKDREDDWIFSTETGHLQLLSNSPGISRLVLVGNLPRDSHHASSTYDRRIGHDPAAIAVFEERLMPILMALSPKSCFVSEFHEIPFLSYEDGVIRSVVVDKCEGSCVGEMLIEDVEVEGDRMREFRRRLRFKRMPNLVQTEIRVSPCRELGSSDVGIGEVEFFPDTSCLVHPYLPPMVAGVSLIASNLEDCVRLGSKPRAFCVGVGGGSLLTFLHTQLGFEVIGVESDEKVIEVAKRYFGLVEGQSLRVSVGDGIEIFKNLAGQMPSCNMGSISALESYGNRDVLGYYRQPFDVIMVDLDSRDARNGLSAPPLEFIQKPVLLGAKSALRKTGILVLNVIPQNRCFYDLIIRSLLEVFPELYELNVGNNENYVIIAAVSPISPFPNISENLIFKKLKSAVPWQYINSIRKLEG